MLVGVPALLLVRLKPGVQPHSLIRCHGRLLQGTLPLQQLLLMLLLLEGWLRKPVLAAWVLEARVLRHLVPRGQVLPVLPSPELWRPAYMDAMSFTSRAASCTRP